MSEDHILECPGNHEGIVADPASCKLASEVDDIFTHLTRWRDAGRQVALATVVQTWGSAPRREGCHLAIDDKGTFVGSVSGGCIEAAVVGEALTTIRDRRAKNLDFRISSDQAWEVGLACGGQLRVYVEPVDDDILRSLASATADRQLIARVTRLEDGSSRLVTDANSGGDLHLSEDQHHEIRRMMRCGRSGPLPGTDGHFVRTYAAPNRLIVVGAVHITQFLAPMATLAGYDVTVIDPRRAFASKERLPGVRICCDWPEEVLPQFGVDGSTAIVVLTHDPKIDDPALEYALESPAFYIGALGSRRTHAQRIERLSALGLDQQLARIRAPIGLALGGREPAEIAAAILAQIIQERYSS